VAGHGGMVGLAIACRLESLGNHDIVTASRAQPNFLDASAVQKFFRANRRERVYVAAAQVCGISANNTRPADFIWNNLVIEANLIKAAHDNDVQRLLFLGGSCIYPKFAQQPIREESLLTGPLESQMTRT
jgi:GDP-L-fucose synthase